MNYTTASGMTIIEGLEPVRARPAMYIGEETPEFSFAERLVEFALGAVVTDTPSPTAVRLLMWKDRVFTIAFDGEPLPVAPSVSPVDGVVPHPELYRFFMHIGATNSGRPLAFAGGALNALSERLVVSTVSGGERYRAVFGRGSLVSLLAKCPCTTPLGTNWLTFRPDARIITGNPNAAQVAAMTKRAAKDSVSVSSYDRTAEDAEWY